MKFKNAFSAISFSILLAVLCFQAFGQNAISPQKRELIKELLVVTEATKLAESTSQAMFAQMEQEMPKFMKQAMLQQADSNKLTAKQRKELEDNYEKTSARIYQRFREKLTGAFNYGELIEQVSLELYDKYFTEDELKDIIAFYKSPTGKKSIKVMPQLVADSMQKSSELVLPKVMNILNEIISEELKTIK